MEHRGPLLLDPSNTMVRPKYFDVCMTRFLVGEYKISPNELAECGTELLSPGKHGLDPWSTQRPESCKLHYYL
jgi:hypothetical protein